MANSKIDRFSEDATNRRRQPVRHCFVSGARRSKEELIRFVVGPDGDVIPDPDERLPGRGLWLSADRKIIQQAITKRLFAKAARRSVIVPSDLLARLEQLFVRRCQERVGLSRRAGQAVAGFEKVQSWLDHGKAGLVIMAQDGGANAHLKRLKMTPRIALTAAELGTVFDRARTVYVAVSSGPLAEKLCVELDRLAGLRDQQIQNLEQRSDQSHVPLMAG